MTFYGTQYRRIPGRDTWHWMPQCQHYKRMTSYHISDEKPSSGELCNECQAKQRRLERNL